jgi:PelA/Pel-15E family pectate lyase
MNDYTHYATFNDDEMPDLMTLLQEVASLPEFELVGPANRKRAKDAFARGIDFILKSQIVVNGKLTAWAQQHDEVTYQPRPGRAFEPVAITGGESASVLFLLMSIADPSPAVVRAIEAGVQWCHDVQLDGLEIVQRSKEEPLVAVLNDFVQRRQHRLYRLRQRARPVQSVVVASWPLGKHFTTGACKRARRPNSTV